MLGPTTNRHFLIRLLEHPEFAAGKATTAFLGKHSVRRAPSVTDEHWKLGRLPAVAAVGGALSRQPARLAQLQSRADAVPPRRRRQGTHAADRRRRSPPRRRTCIDGNDIVVDLDAFTVRFQDRTYMPPASAAAGSDGKLRAPMDGRIVAIKVAAGDKVVRGQTLVVLEAMKIQHQLKAALDAEVESIAVQEGQQVANRTVLVTMAADAAAR